MKTNRKNVVGFTLVEVMIVVCIIGLLAAIAIPNIAMVRSNSRARMCVSNLIKIEKAKFSWYDLHAKGTNTFLKRPSTLSDLGLELKCPDGGEYVVGTDLEIPRCSFGVTQESQGVPSGSVVHKIR